MLYAIKFNKLNAIHVADTARHNIGPTVKDNNYINVEIKVYVKSSFMF